MAKKKAKLKEKFKGVPVRTQLAIVTGSVCLLALFGTFVGWLDTQVDLNNLLRKSGSSSFSYGDVIIRGESTCLKHKAKGPQTEECTVGIKTPSGDYAVVGTPTKGDNNTLEAQGTLSQPSRDSIYTIQGVITVK